MLGFERAHSVECFLEGGALALSSWTDGVPALVNAKICKNSYELASLLRWHAGESSLQRAVQLDDLRPLLYVRREARQKTAVANATMSPQKRGCPLSRNCPQRLHSCPPVDLTAWRPPKQRQTKSRS